MNAAVTELAVPAWVGELRAIGGEQCPFISITAALPFLPTVRNKELLGREP